MVFSIISGSLILSVGINNKAKIKGKNKAPPTKKIFVYNQILLYKNPLKSKFIT
jgi:hypothetical protein